MALFAGRVHGAEQSSYIAELTAVERVLIAAAKVGVREITVICDNLNVVQGVQRVLDGVHVASAYGFFWWGTIRDTIRKLRVVRIYWVPSHGKVNNQFTMPTTQYGTEKQWREWNEIADKQAEIGRRRNERSLHVQFRAQEREDAAKWSMAALERAILGVGEYILRDREATEQWGIAFKSYAERDQ